MINSREQNKLDRIKREQKAMNKKMELRRKIENKKEQLTLHSYLTV